MDKTVILWDVETGVCQHTLTGHSEPIRWIEYSPHGHQIASASDDKTVRLWNTKTGDCYHILIGHQENVSRVVYSPRGDQVASASCRDKTVRLWDTASSGECRHTLVGHAMGIYAIAYSPRGDLLASWSDTGEGRLWDVETGDCCWNLPYDGSTQSGGVVTTNPFVWMSLDVDAFIAGCDDGSVMVWDVIKEGDQYHVHRRWRSTNGQLDVEDAWVQDVQGLSHFNKQLLWQRGALGEPDTRLL